MTDHPVKVGTKEEIDPVNYGVWMALSTAHAVHADRTKREFTEDEKRDLERAAELLKEASNG